MLTACGDNHCSMCTSANVCVKCDNGYTLYNNICTGKFNLNSIFNYNNINIKNLSPLN